MEQNRIYKIIYEDSGITKCLKCLILSEEDFIYNVEALGSKEKIIIGKRSIIKISSIGDSK